MKYNAKDSANNYLTWLQTVTKETNTSLINKMPEFKALEDLHLERAMQLFDTFKPFIRSIYESSYNHDHPDHYKNNQYYSIYWMCMYKLVQDYYEKAAKYANSGVLDTRLDKLNNTNIKNGIIEAYAKQAETYADMVTHHRLTQILQHHRNLSDRINSDRKITTEKMGDLIATEQEFNQFIKDYFISKGSDEYWKLIPNVLEVERNIKKLIQQKQLYPQRKL